jgi:hypothetical protein
VPPDDRFSLPVVTVPCDEYKPRCGATCCHLKVSEELWDAARGVCIHLQVDLRCAVYDARPAVCRAFDCRVNPATKAKIARL